MHKPIESKGAETGLSVEEYCRRHEITVTVSILLSCLCNIWILNFQRSGFVHLWLLVTLYLVYFKDWSVITHLSLWLFPYVIIFWLFSSDLLFVNLFSIYLNLFIVFNSLGRKCAPTIHLISIHWFSLGDFKRGMCTTLISRVT